MIRALVTIFAGLFGLAFGSFLNVCVSRWPEGESITSPRSHCRNCEHPLAWWENIPLLSWIVLRGRCHDCRAWISMRYPMAELAVGALWAVTIWRATSWLLDPTFSLRAIAPEALATAGTMLFYWLLVALATLDAEHLWLPNKITLPGILLGFLFSVGKATLVALSPVHDSVSTIEALKFEVIPAAIWSIAAIVFCGGLLLLIRWLYWVFRHRDGMGLGDVKLIAMLAAWLGLPQTLLAFFISAMLGAIAGIAVIVAPSRRESGQDWATAKLPFGTFLCIGGIVASLWGQPIIAAYLHSIGL